MGTIVLTPFTIFPSFKKYYQSARTALCHSYLSGLGHRHVFVWLTAWYVLLVSVRIPIMYAKKDTFFRYPFQYAWLSFAFVRTLGGAPTCVTSIGAATTVLDTLFLGAGRWYVSDASSRLLSLPWRSLSSMLLASFYFLMTPHVSANFHKLWIKDRTAWGLSTISSRPLGRVCIPNAVALIFYLDFAPIHSLFWSTFFFHQTGVNDPPVSWIKVSTA